MHYFAKSFIVFLLVVLWTSCDQATDKTTARSEKALNSGWLFVLGHDTTRGWEPISLPHTAKTEPLVVNNQWQGTMWYKKTLVVSDASKRYVLKFEGLMQTADLYINNKFVARHLGGYLPFHTDISTFLDFEKPNEIKLLVNNQDNAEVPPGKALKTLDFNYYGGIYRPASLLITNKIYITDAIEFNKKASGGILVHFDSVSTKWAAGVLKIAVKNESTQQADLYGKVSLTSARGQVTVFESEPVKIDPQHSQELLVKLEMPNPELWSVQNPQLYALTVKVFSGALLVDSDSLKVGIRSIKLTNNAFYLNNKPLYLRGTNRHQEYPYVGYALSANANWRDAIKIKQAGFDFVRLSHYPQSNSFLDACDALGILVMNAIPGWQFFGDSIFVENAYHDIRNMVRRDRNHACMAFWEVSLNESAMSDAFMEQANEILKEELPFDDTYSCGWIDHPAYDLFIPARQHAKPPHYWNLYKVGERPVFIAEYGDWEYYAQNAGFNQTAYADLKAEERTSRQLRGAGEKQLLQQALNFQEAANSNRKGSNTIGHANWLMFDYNRGYAHDLESSGICDIFRIPKFAFYFYQSQRDPDDTLVLKNGTGPMVKLATYYNNNSSLDIKVFSNCEEVALYQNNRLIAQKKPTIDAYSDQLKHPPFHFKLPGYASGTLKAIGFISGKKVATDSVQSPLAAAGINLELNDSGLAVSNQESDLLFVYAKITDPNGTLVTDSDMMVTFNAQGAELIGENPVKAEAGIASLLIKTTAKQAFRISAVTGSFKAEQSVVPE